MLLPLLLALVLADAPPALTVRVTGLADPAAPVHAALFATKEAWNDGGEPLLSARLQPEDGACEWRIAELATGEYAVRAFQDLDGDGALGRSELGKPREPYGFSGGRKGLFGPPGWKKARVELRGDPAVVEVELRGAGGD